MMEDPPVKKEETVRRALESAFGSLEVVFTCKGVRREDGRTAAELEAAIERGEV